MYYAYFIFYFLICVKNIKPEIKDFRIIKLILCNSCYDRFINATKCYECLNC